MAARKKGLARLAQFDAHHRLFMALAGATVAFLVLPPGLTWAARGLAAWNTYGGITIALAWLTIVHANPAEVAKNARLEDVGRIAIFCFVVLSACVSLLSVGLLLGTAKNLNGPPLAEHIIFAALTIVLSWSLVHTVYTLHYAHMFYSLNDKNEPGGGVDFPKEPAPDYLDFAYFSFVIGMTCQVSDVDVTGRQIRRAALLHGVISFGFNTAVVALGVNLASSLFTK